MESYYGPTVFGPRPEDLRANNQFIIGQPDYYLSIHQHHAATLCELIPEVSTWIGPYVA